MDPVMYHLDWARVAEVLVAVIILSFILERALALLFESRFFLEVVQGKKPKGPGAAGAEGTAGAGKEKSKNKPTGEGEAAESEAESPATPEAPKGVGTFPIKESIALVVSAAVCLIWHFDAVSMIFPRTGTTALGAIITGGVVAGGSKASIRLFRDVMGVKSTARKLLDDEAAEQKKPK
jgi:hypothetical protein